jgi:hypothetical protein
MTRILRIQLEVESASNAPATHGVGTIPGNEPHIRRQANPRSWVVHATVQGKNLEMKFTDALFGGTMGALDAARWWRDAQLWYEPSWGEAPSVNRIRRYEYPARGKSAVCAVWCASGVNEDGEKWVREFCVREHGEEDAMHKAKDWHDARLAELKVPKQRRRVKSGGEAQ